MRRIPSRIWRACTTAPFEMAVAAYVAAIGTAGITSGGSLAPRSIDSTLPFWLILAWSVGLAVGGITTLAGRILGRDRLESAGLGFIIYGNLLYCLVLAYAASWPSALASFSAMLAIATGAGMRMRVLALSRRAVKKASEDDS